MDNGLDERRSHRGAAILNGKHSSWAQSPESLPLLSSSIPNIINSLFGYLQWPFSFLSSHFSVGNLWISNLFWKLS
jgi:hypothetical protein